MTVADPAFSIIVLSFNKIACTRRCMDALLTSQGSRFELIVVEQGSTDGSAEMLEACRGRFEDAGHAMTLIRNTDNVGASTGRNQAIEIARGGRIAFLDNDIYVGTPDWLSRLAAVLDQDDRIGIVGPRLVFAWDPKTIQFAGGGVSRSGRVQFVGRGCPADDARFSVPRDVQFVISACMMVPRKLLDEIGAFDEAFNPVQYEDIDLCYRARAAGYRAVYTPTVQMLHDESATTAGEPSLKNNYLVIKHGMEFKRRWRHLFEQEDGPEDTETLWKPIGRFAPDPRSR